jgi:hypothetical protein
MIFGTGQDDPWQLSIAKPLTISAAMQRAQHVAAGDGFLRQPLVFFKNPRKNQYTTV